MDASSVNLSSCPFTETPKHSHSRMTAASVLESTTKTLGKMRCHESQEPAKINTPEAKVATWIPFLYLFLLLSPEISTLPKQFPKDAWLLVVGPIYQGPGIKFLYGHLREVMIKGLVFCWENLHRKPWLSLGFPVGFHKKNHLRSKFVIRPESDVDCTLW